MTLMDFVDKMVADKGYVGPAAEKLSMGILSAATALVQTSQLPIKVLEQITQVIDGPEAQDAYRLLKEKEDNRKC